MLTDYTDYSDFNEFSECESVTLFNGLTLTEGNERDKTEFFSLSMLENYLTD